MDEQPNAAESLPQNETLPQNEAPSQDEAVGDQTSAEFVSRWNHLISTTNWEKGHIIHQWRRALIEADAPVGEYSDETWSRRVGNITGQHAGRLRRVFERFGQSVESYPGLYWSHFQAALDWNDAELWLEGAVRENWSISKMRNARWEAIGAPADMKPSDADIIVAELDEDANSAFDSAEDPAITGSQGTVQAPGDGPSGPDLGQGPDFGDDDAPVDGAPFDEADDTEAASAEPVRPFEHLESLPADLADAMESFKIAILHHKMSGWKEVSADQVVATLDALKHFALLPADG
ncbi:MAG: hypothetical protein HQ581_27550 [Planctomycetes bacterium]|nr:hypothetical protein [Planctomycetota bacterium]